MVKKKPKKKRPSIVLTAQQREQLDLEQKRDRLQKERFQKKAQAAEKEATLEVERPKNAEERKFAVEQRRKAKGGHGHPPQLLAAAALSLTPQTEEVLRKPRHPFGASTKAPPPMAPLCEKRPQKPSHPVGNNPKQVPGGTKEIDAPLVNIHHNVEMIKANVRSGLDGSKSVSVDQQGNRVAHGAMCRCNSICYTETRTRCNVVIPRDIYDSLSAMMTEWRRRSFLACHKQPAKKSVHNAAKKMKTSETCLERNVQRRGRQVQKKCSGKCNCLPLLARKGRACVSHPLPVATVEFLAQTLCDCTSHP